MWVHANVEEIMGVKLRYPRPIIDGFRFEFKNGETISLNYTVEPMEKGYFYRFTPSLKLKGNEGGYIQFHVSEDIDEILDLTIVARKIVTRTLKKTWKTHGLVRRRDQRRDLNRE